MEEERFEKMLEAKEGIMDSLQNLVNLQKTKGQSKDFQDWKKFIINKEKERVLSLLRLKCVCRIRGLKVDIQNAYKYEGRLQEYEELLRHLENIDYIVADIECAKKYLSKGERDLLKKLKQEGGNSSQP